MPKLIILDRDGVINHDSTAYIKSPAEWMPIPGSLEAIAKLHKTGHSIAIASNQSGIAREYFDLATLEAIHSKMLSLVKKSGGMIDYITFCTDSPQKPTSRRKPGAGMLFEISKKLNIPLSDAVFIGDSYSDYGAAKNAPCRFILVRTGKGGETLIKHPNLLDSIPIYDNLAIAVENLLQDPTSCCQ